LDKASDVPLDKALAGTEIIPPLRLFKRLFPSVAVEKMRRKNPRLLGKVSPAGTEYEDKSLELSHLKMLFRCGTNLHHFAHADLDTFFAFEQVEQF
jgi:hypothetical protein